MDTITALQTASSSKDPGVQAALLKLLEKQAELASLQMDELQETRGKRAEAIRIAKVMQEGTIADEKKKAIAVKNHQAGCDHRKPAPSHESAIAGQRDHQGVAHFICQYCAQEWTGGELPLSLRIPGDRLGGPQI